MEKHISEFISDLKDMAEGCIGNKPKTARSKASRLLDTYEGLFAHNTNQIRSLQSELRIANSALQCLRSDKIQYGGGFIKISDVVHVEKKGMNFLLMLSGGRQVEFEVHLYLDLFKKIFNIHLYDPLCLK